jgi:hypothetical protein
MNAIVILALIQALQQKVVVLELALAQMQSGTVAVAPLVSSTPIVAQQTYTPENVAAQTSTLATAVAPVLTVPVNFTSSGNLGYVTIRNTLDQTIRVKNIEVDGQFDHLSFSDAPNWTFQAHFDCNGLGSLGYRAIYGNPHLDVCARHDNGKPVNEIEPGETMTIEYSESPTGIATGTIETDSGEAVNF